jgi:hypothetical protein
MRRAGRRNCSAWKREWMSRAMRVTSGVVAEDGDGDLGVFLHDLEALQHFEWGEFDLVVGLVEGGEDVGPRRRWTW